MGNTYSKKLFKEPPGATLVDIIRIVGHFPRFAELDTEEDFIKPFTMGELEGTFKWFKKDKSSGPDGWSVEFYLAFFDIIGPDLIKMIEEF